MKKLIYCLLLLGIMPSVKAQQMDEAFKRIQKYMGVNVYAGYAHQTFEHASLGRFVQSFNTVYASRLQTNLSLPTYYRAPYVGMEVSLGAIRTGFAHTFNPSLHAEAKYTNGSIRKLMIETPKNNWYIDILVPISGGKAFLGMTTGMNFGYYKLHSYIHNNFGIDTYANGDYISGIYKSDLNLQTRLGIKLDINFSRKIGLSFKAEGFNKLNFVDETGITGWKDWFYSEATLPDSRDRYMYLAEDVRQASNSYVYFGNTSWQSSPAVYGSPKGFIYSVSLNIQAIGFKK